MTPHKRKRTIPKTSKLWIPEDDYNRLKQLSNDMSHRLGRKVTISEIANAVFMYGIENFDRIKAELKQIKNRREQEAKIPCRR